MALIRNIKAFFGHFEEPDITPGDWFITYALEWAEYHGISYYKLKDTLTSGIVDGANGWIWVTATPEWDRFWFEGQGFSFPSRWCTWDSIQEYEGEPGSYLKLDI